LYENFGTLLLAEDIKRETPLAQSLYFHNAAINTVARSIKSNQDCGCTPDPGYYADKKSFWCQEDFKINVNKLLDIVKKGNFQLTEGQQKVYTYLKANAGETITIDKIYSFSEPKEAFMKRVEAFRLNYHPSGQSSYTAKERSVNTMNVQRLQERLQGSDLGCCANYSGNCWYNNDICFWHDVYCLCCSDWWCLWGCKKESFCK
jgi:hydrogenase maturation factor HypF (carbamoyltransferase family)